MQVIQHFLNNSLRNFNYIVISDINKDAIFFDPADIDQTLPLCHQENARAKYLVNTHYHPDHDKDNSKLLKTTEAEEVILEDQEILELSGRESIKCLFTPGHVSDHKCYILAQDNESLGIVCGDTIFNAGMGNCKNGGNVEVLYNTFKNVISKLPDHLKIYPSHDYFITNLKFSLTVEPDNDQAKKYLDKKIEMDKENKFLITTIGEERLYNPFFRVFDPEFKNKYDRDEKELFIHLRKLRDKW